MKMSRLYLNVHDIAVKFNVHEFHSLWRHNAKLNEEVGELTTEINKLTGVKSMKEGQWEVKQKLIDEVGDVLQNIFLIAQLNGFTFEDVKDALDRANKKWEEKYSSTRTTRTGQTFTNEPYNTTAANQADEEECTCFEAREDLGAGIKHKLDANCPIHGETREFDRDEKRDEEHLNETSNLNK